MLVARVLDPNLAFLDNSDVLRASLTDAHLKALAALRTVQRWRRLRESGVNQQIAKESYLSTETVKNHVRCVIRKVLASMKRPIPTSMLSWCTPLLNGMITDHDLRRTTADSLCAKGFASV